MGGGLMYEIQWFRGDYGERQRAANAAGVVCYVEAHFNALANDRPGMADNPALCIVGSNASATSRNWAAWFTAAVAAEFGIRDGGVLVGPKRGDWNVRLTAMPAILLEPLFVSDPEQAEIARSEQGQDRLARIIADSVRRFFPEGGPVGFSVGHKYKRSAPHDRGAPVHGGGTEAELAEQVLQRAAKLLTHGLQVGDPARVVRIVEAGEQTQEIVIDPDAVVSWNPVTETLTIGG